MDSIRRKIIGLIFVIAGFILIVVSALFLSRVLVFYGIPALILGIIIFFNKGEDKIEERKDLNKSKVKK